MGNFVSKEREQLPPFVNLQQTSMELAEEYL
jgi:hypothetical protein